MFSPEQSPSQMTTHDVGNKCQKTSILLEALKKPSIKTFILL